MEACRLISFRKRYFEKTRNILESVVYIKNQVTQKIDRRKLRILLSVDQAEVP